MKENLLSAIKAHDFTAIRNICFALSEEERNDLIHTLQTARWEQLYHNTDKRAPRLQSLDIVCFSYIFLGLMDKINAKKLYKPLFYLPLQAFENMNKKYAFTVAVK